MEYRVDKETGAILFTPPPKSKQEELEERISKLEEKVFELEKAIELLGIIEQSLSEKEGE